MGKRVLTFFVICNSRRGGKGGQPNYLVLHSTCIKLYLFTVQQWGGGRDVTCGYFHIYTCMRLYIHVEPSKCIRTNVWIVVNCHCSCTNCRHLNYALNRQTKNSTTFVFCCYANTTTIVDAWGLFAIWLWNHTAATRFLCVGGQVGCQWLQIPHVR